MTRKKQQKSKKQQQNPGAAAGVFISNLLGGGRSAQVRRSSAVGHPPVSELSPNEGKNSSLATNLQSVVLCKTVLELALVNIALSGQTPRDTNIMAPPVSSSTNSAPSGLSKLMSPVQDLGKSLLGFLIGSPPSNTQQPPAPASSEPSLPSRRTSGVPPAWETSVPTSPGRQRPPGHPALGPSVSSTPVVIRRNKVVRSETLSLTSDTASVKISSVTEEPERVKAMPRNQSQNSRRKKNRSEAQKPSEANTSSSPPQEASIVKPSRSQSRNSRRRKAKRAAVAAAAASSSPQCHQDNEDVGDHETGSGKTEPVSLGVQASQDPDAITNEIVSNKSHETSCQEVPESPDWMDDSHDLMAVDSKDSGKELTVNDTPTDIVIKRKSYTNFSAQTVEDEQNAGFVTARNSVMMAECHESESPCDIFVTGVNSGQSNCHTEEKSSEEVKEIKRKEVLDIQDDLDKASREVAEQPGSVKISSDASREEGLDVGNGCQSRTDLSQDNIPSIASGPPPPPPLPPQGFLLEGLKLDRKESVQRLCFDFLTIVSSAGAPSLLQRAECSPGIGECDQ